MGAGLVSCDVLGLDPNACFDDGPPWGYDIAEFRITQANQTHANDVPLFVFKDAGWRVRITADVERPTIANMTVAVHAIGADSTERALVEEAFDCTRPSSMLTGHLDAEVVAGSDAYRLRVTGHAGDTVIDAIVSPARVDGQEFTLVFVPLIVNGQQATMSDAQQSDWERQAHALVPTAPESSLFAPHDVGEVADYPSTDASLELILRLREQIGVWYEVGVLPEHAIVVGLLPRPDGWGGTGGRGGSYSAVTDELDRTVFLHELAHAFWVPHAPGCGAPNPAPEASDLVDPVGYNIATRAWMDGHDLMTYCRDTRTWLGAWAQPYVVRAFEYGQSRPRPLEILAFGD
jgi:hypothetical protein